MAKPVDNRKIRQFVKIIAVMAHAVIAAGAFGISVAVAQDATRPTAPAARSIKVDRSQLSYDGRSFDEWQSDFVRELNPQKRIEALPVLVKFARHGFAADAAATIAEALEDDSHELIDAATEHLAKLGEAAVPVLVEKLKSESAIARFAAAEALKQIGPAAAEAIPALLPIAALAFGAEIPPADLQLAEAAYFALEQIVTARTPQLREGLQSGSSGMRALCTKLITQAFEKGLGEVSVPVDQLLRLLGDENGTVRSAAAVALWQLAADSPKVTAALVRAVDEDAKAIGYDLANSFYRRQDYTFHGQVCSVPTLELSRHAKEHSDVAVSLLVGLLDWPDFANRRSAVTIGPRSGGGPQEVPPPQEKVFHLLALFGPRAAPAVPSLVHLLKSPDLWIRCAAVDVLGVIGAPAGMAEQALRELAADETRVESTVLISPRAEVGIPVAGRAENDDNPPVTETSRDTLGDHVRAALLRISTPPK